MPPRIYLGAMSRLVTPSNPYYRFDISSSLANLFSLSVMAWYSSASPSDFASR